MSAKQKANRTAFGNKFGKGRTTATAQIEREAKRLTAYHSKKK